MKFRQAEIMYAAIVYGGGALGLAGAGVLIYFFVIKRWMGG